MASVCLIDDKNQPKTEFERNVPDIFDAVYFGDNNV